MGNSYFLGANTSSGFAHCAEDVLNTAEKLYIIKGGPGTGKSRLMEEIAKAAEAKNMLCDRYYCSSDPSSLDGIYVHDIGLCLTDGTAPHMRDPRYPGAVDEIVDLSRFWNTAHLESDKDTITSLCNKKKKLYDEVYAYMSACDDLFEAEKIILESCVAKEKICDFVKRVFRSRGTGSGFSLTKRQTQAIGMKGSVSFDTFASTSNEVYLISDTRGIDIAVYDAVIEELKRRDYSAYVSHDPMRNMVINAVFVPELSMAFTSKASDTESCKIINTDRFIIKKKISENRSKLRRVSHLRNELKDVILTRFKEISAVHFALEDIYIGAMDFKKKEEFTAELKVKIFG